MSKLSYITQLMHLLQLSDSALPIGLFSFSNTLESAVEWGVVRDKATLKEYCAQIMLSTATGDALAAADVWRACQRGDYAGILHIDNMLFRSKLNGEARQMTQRMGHKLAELGRHLLAEPMLRRWAEELRQGGAAGCCATSQGIIAAACGIGEAELFCSVCYGAVTMVLGAALRSMRITHIETQQISFSLAPLAEELFAAQQQLTAEQMHGFMVEADIMASLHEKGYKRLFMN